MVRLLLVIGVCASVLVPLSAQSPTRFEVASIRRSPEPPQALPGLQISATQARFSYMSLNDYIGIAYGVRIHQIVGPKWLGSARFEIVAKIPEGQSSPLLNEMMRALLEERFRMRSHRESREFAVYALEAKGATLVRVPDEAPPEGPFTVMSGENGAGGKVINLGNGATLTLGSNRFDAKKVTMATFADVLARFVDRPVVDMTGLEGRYNVAFEVAPEDFQAMMMRSTAAAGVALSPEALHLLDKASVVAVPDALERLGLLLRSRRAPLEVLVIDSVERTPTEN